MAPCKRNNPVGSAISRSPKSKRQRQHRVPPAETYPIPDRLQDVVERVERKRSLFELKLPINDLNGVQRLAWGLDCRADLVIVNLEFLQGEDRSSGHARFCVHSSTDREKRTHLYSSTKNEASRCIENPCSPRSTILTCVLSRELFGLLGLRGCRDLEIVYDRAFELIKSDPTKRCLICGKRYEVKVYTPTACLGECMDTLEQWPLRARLSHLLSDTKVFDLMLCCIYTAVKGQEVCPDQYETKSSLLVDCPLELAAIQPVIDSFTEISDELGLHRLVNSGDTRVASSQKRRLLSWLALRLRGCIVSLPHNVDFFMQGKGLEGSHQFMLLNSRLERQQAFMEQAIKVDGGSVAFRGARAPRAFNIITDALRNMISEPYAVDAAGVFYSDSPGYSYCVHTPRDISLKAWKRSQFFGQAGQGWAVLFGLEVALSEIRFEDNEHSTHRVDSDDSSYISVTII
ncbi:hypothetical protein INS49_005247 [Diaporthe citri]|uniref:uncharacterized protein n=1 Tax=Diaporthe citri TaxID=83186 RepID=UPI001C7F0440|nr:uncharacterized protein INS49_005247 [Diaporthe citri]KAG6353768.1 hypothetical protein INS49_005247 [Diaporthe citri]